MKINGFIAITSLCAIVLAVAGCNEPAKITDPSEPLCMPMCAKEDIMKAAEDVLADKCFTVEKFDVENGYISTRPMRGSQPFEFWRGDNVGTRNKRMSANQSLQRIVEIEFLQGDGGWCVSCYAHLRRFSMSDEEYVSMSSTHAIYTSSSLTTMKLTPRDNDIEWIEMGRDYALENDILDKIKLNLTAVSGNSK